MKKAQVIRRIISTIFSITLLVIAFNIYSYNNFNEFIRAEYQSGISDFSRDSSVKYSKASSYRIENSDYNDAMFFQKIKVIPNTAYRVTCMIKTSEVINKDENVDAGAHICIYNSTEKSDNVIGTKDWTEVQLLFNSKNRTEVEIGFRLGGNYGNSKGTAWFSDFKIESGNTNESSAWNFLCLVFNKTQVNIEVHGNNRSYDLSLSKGDVEDMRTCMSRFASSMYELSKHKMSVTYDFIEVNEPITSMSYDEENGYYVAPYNVSEVLDKYIAQGKYDHIFITFRTGDINSKDEIPVNDWIGLGGMEYRNVGFSNVRLPNSNVNYVYKYDDRVNTFPEEVFVHEFLHTLERNAEEYGYERPELHSYEKNGYKNENQTGLKRWYADYMNKEIKSWTGDYIGLPKEIFTKKPVKADDFKYATQLEYFNEPSNIIEELNGVYKKLVNLFRIIKVNNNASNNISTNEIQSF